MKKHPINDLVDYQTVEDILIELTDDKTFFAVVVDNFGDRGSTWIRHSTPSIERNIIRFHECLFDNQFKETDVTDWSNMFRAKIIEKTYDVIKTRKTAIINIKDPNYQRIYDGNQVLKDTIQHIKNYLGDEMLNFTTTKGFFGADISIIIEFNSYTTIKLRETVL